MATIKSFTSLEQSKKLAEILPIESADMYYTPSLIKGHTNYFPHLKRKFPIDWDIEQAIPCWSLATLLGVLQNPSLHKTYTGWRCDIYNENCTKCRLGDTADNPIDACVAMIEKLYKLNLL